MKYYLEVIKDKNVYKVDTDSEIEIIKFVAYLNSPDPFEEDDFEDYIKVDMDLLKENMK